MRMEYVIRPLREEECPLLEDFLYEAIFLPEGCTGELPRSILRTDPRLAAAIRDFGSLPHDDCLVAEVEGAVIGAVWVRIAEEYGHMDDETPSFAISLYRPYRGQGIGTALMRQMLERLREKGYPRASLGVNKENYALRMYEKLGFQIVGDGADETEWLMVCPLR